MSPELYLIDWARRWLNDRYGTNYTLFEYGTKRPPPEMDDPAPVDNVRNAQYLGLPQTTGAVASGVRSLMASLSSVRHVTISTPAAAIDPSKRADLLARASAAAARAEARRAAVLPQPPSSAGILARLATLLWTFATTFLAWALWTALLAAALAALYLLLQGALYLPLLDRVQRRVWWEDLAAYYGVGDAVAAGRDAIFRALGWCIAAPFRALGATYRFVVGSEPWAVLRRRRAAGAEWVYGRYLAVRYNETTDWWRRRRSASRNWVKRNGWRIFWACVWGPVLWKVASVTVWKGEAGESLRAMAARRGVPAEMLEHEGAWNAWGYGWSRGGQMGLMEGDEEMVYRWRDAEEEEMVSVRGDEDVVVRWGNADEEGGEEVAVGVEEVEKVGPEGVEMVADEPEKERPGDVAPEGPRRPIGEGRVAFCRKCRQRHCCEAVEEDPAPLVLFPEN